MYWRNFLAFGVLRYAASRLEHGTPQQRDSAWRDEASSSRLIHQRFLHDVELTQNSLVSRVDSTPSQDRLKRTPRGLLMTLMPAIFALKTMEKMPLNDNSYVLASRTQL